MCGPEFGGRVDLLRSLITRRLGNLSVTVAHLYLLERTLGLREALFFLFGGSFIFR